MLADGAYANSSLVPPVRKLQIQLVSRLRSDARLYRPQPRLDDLPAGVGASHVTVRRWPDCRCRGWCRKHVDIYGKYVQLNVHECLAWWPPLKCVIKVVVTRDPKNARRVAFLWTSDTTMPAHRVIEAFVQRWSIEQLFCVAKLQFGLDSAEIRKQRVAILHAAHRIAMVTWIEVWSYRFLPHQRERSFVHKIAALRTDTIKQTVFASGPCCQGSGRFAFDLANVFAIATRTS